MAHGSFKDYMALLQEITEALVSSSGFMVIDTSPFPPASPSWHRHCWCVQGPVRDTHVTADGGSCNAMLQIDYLAVMGDTKGL